MTTGLNAARRRADLAALADRDSPLDILVIGGGVTGAAVALDARRAGLRVALVRPTIWRSVRRDGATRSCVQRSGLPRAGIFR